MTRAVLVDLRKAFDSVWHDGLMYEYETKKIEKSFIKDDIKYHNRKKA